MRTITLPSLRFVAACSMLCVVILNAPSAKAYSTGAHWSGPFLVFRVKQSLANDLPGLFGQQSSVVQNIGNAAGEWNKGSWFTFNYNSGDCSFPQIGCFSAAGIDPKFWAVTGWHADPSTHVLDQAEVQFNSIYTWHLNGQEPDVFRIALHEFGHTLTLLDDPLFTWGGSQQAVEWYNPGKTALYIDDKEGATMLYGPWTQFEVSQYLGLYQTFPLYSTSVSGFDNCGSGDPDYWTYDRGSVGIPYSPNGGRVMQFRGCAVYNGSSPNYAYMPFATSFEDSPSNQGPNKCGDPCYLKVTSGMHLSWEQYNALQCKVSVDLEFADGTTLRDSGLTDNYGNSVHPASRPCFSGWRTFTVDLSPLAGKTIRRILIAYDNPNGLSKWRNYFDDLKITY